MKEFIWILGATLPAAVAICVAVLRLRGLARVQYGLCEVMLLPLTFTPTLIATADTLIASHSVLMSSFCLSYQCAGGLLLFATAQANGKTGWPSALMMLCGAWIAILPGVAWVVLLALLMPK